MKFRYLRADEVDCRVATCKEGGLSLLLYKDARVDMNVLDETVGPMNWQKEYRRDNANCVVRIWDSEKQQWIAKEDTGTESNTEAEKGLASDSFKRACFNWGIGRELYTAPFIWITSSKCTIGKSNGGKPACWDRFRVADMTVEDGKITHLVILNESRNGEVVFKWARKPQSDQKTDREEQKVIEADKNTTKTPTALKTPGSAEIRKAVTIEAAQVNLLRVAMEQIGQTEGPMLKHYGLDKIEDMNAEQYIEAMDLIRACKDKRRKK